MPKEPQDRKSPGEMSKVEMMEKIQEELLSGMDAEKIDQFIHQATEKLDKALGPCDENTQGEWPSSNYARLEDLYKYAHIELTSLLSESRERSLALTNLQQAIMWTREGLNRAVAVAQIGKSGTSQSP